MLKTVPEKGLSLEEVSAQLEMIASRDMLDDSGKLFSYVYMSGRKDLGRIMEFYNAFVNKNALDFTVFPSSLALENDLVSMSASLLNGDSETVGTFTSGGAESILLSIKTGRDYFLSKRREFEGKPEMIIPRTAHPAFVKGAQYFGLELKIAPVNQETFKVEPEEMRKLITDRTAIIVGSAPSYPIGVMDPIEALSEIALEKGIWLHVDACLGGFILPFFQKLGEEVEKYDFSVPGVHSISIDLHKYGYTPKGASLLLYRNKELRKYQIFTNASWPGYPLVNTTMQSTKSIGPVVGAWATINYLGMDSYLDLARKVISAKKKLMAGLTELGFKTLGHPDSSIVAFHHDGLNIFLLAEMLKKDGWFLQVQPGSVELGLPASLHMTLTATHDDKIPQFLQSLRKNVDELGQDVNAESPEVLDSYKEEVSDEDRGKYIDLISKALTGRGTEQNGTYTINKLVRSLPHDVIEKLYVEIVNEIFKPTGS